MHWQEPPAQPHLDHDNPGLERRGAVYQGIEGAPPLWPQSLGGGPWPPRALGRGFSGTTHTQPNQNNKTRLWS